MISAAQAQQKQPSFEEQALYSKLSTEVGAGLQCSVSLMQVQRALAEAQAELKALKEKPTK